jgi:hypothetical protein
MGKVYDVIDERLRAFMADQPVFFVATGPDSGGHVNVSPKGYRDTFAVLDGTTVAYLDLFGSGAETIAHLRENRRITIMFCSFGRQPKILRLYGSGRVVRPDDPGWHSLAGHFGTGHAGTRAAIVVDLERIADSCGYSVPFMELAGERSLLDDQHARRGPDEWAKRVRNNAESIDGLPTLSADHPLPSSLSAPAAT